jgi:hypothetical protein
MAARRPGGAKALIDDPGIRHKKPERNRRWLAG